MIPVRYVLHGGLLCLSKFDSILIFFVTASVGVGEADVFADTVEDRRLGARGSADLPRQVKNETK